MDVEKVGLLEESVEDGTAHLKDLSLHRSKVIRDKATVCATITRINSLAVDLSIIVLGAVYIDYCSAETKIPVYLIVSGALDILFLFLEVRESSPGLFNRQSNGASDVPVADGFIRLSFLVAVAFYVVGNVWIFRSIAAHQSANPDMENHCDPFFYVFAVGATVFRCVNVFVSMCIYIFSGKTSC